MSLFLRWSELPIGAIWRSAPRADGRVEVIGYDRPENAEAMTIPPLTPTQIGMIELPPRSDLLALYAGI